MLVCLILNHLKSCFVTHYLPEENWPPDWAWFLPRFFFSISVLFWFLATVAFGLLIWWCLTDCTDTIGNELTWMMTSVSHQWTDFSWKKIIALLTNYFPVKTVKLLWHNKYCKKRYIKIKKNKCTCVLFVILFILALIFNWSIICIWIPSILQFFEFTRHNRRPSHILWLQ